jgi:hypothetical protein
MKCRILAEKVARGTQPSSESSTGGMGRKASLAPRKMVKRRIGGWLGQVDWVMMPMKSSRIYVEVYLCYLHQLVPLVLMFDGGGKCRSDIP